MLYALILYESGGTYNLTSTLNDRFFWESFSWQFYLLSGFLAEICWEKNTEEIFLFIFLFYAWPGIRTRSLRLRSQHYTNRHTFDYSLILQQYLKSYLSPLKYKKKLAMMHLSYNSFVSNTDYIARWFPIIYITLIMLWFLIQ